MQIVIEIPKEMHKAFVQGSFGAKYNMYDLVGCVMNGTLLPEYMKELKRRLLMEVDGGTDDRYLRYADVCDRISNTIDTYITAESEDKEIENDREESDAEFMCRVMSKTINKSTDDRNFIGGF